VIPAYHPLPELHRLGTLAIVAAASSCDSEPGATFHSGWVDVPGQDGMCSAYFGQKTTYRYYACPSDPFCYDVHAWCCVPAGTPPGGCSVDDIRDLKIVRATSERSYCQGAGPGPYLTSVTPSTLLANHIDQTVDVRGVGLQQGGRVVGSWKTEWISSTHVRALLDGSQLTTTGVQNLIGYQNPLPGGTSSQFDDTFPSNRLEVTLVAPSVVCPLPPLSSSEPPWEGQCASAGGTCGCSVDFDPGDGVHHFAMDCDATDGICTCTRDGVVVNSISNASKYVCEPNNILAYTWRQACAWRQGFCP
jgi:hypothetical protein